LEGSADGRPFFILILMKIFVLITAFLMLLDASRKHNRSAATADVQKDSVQTTTAANSSKPENTNLENSKTKGKVSHRYAANGCAVIIIVTTDTGEEMVLIPKTPLENKFNKDGLELYFNYYPLKMMQPAGCETGVPAEITDITLK
jgi:hypothetical protein